MPHVPLPPSDDALIRPLPPLDQKITVYARPKLGTQPLPPAVTAAPAAIKGVISKDGPVLYLVRVKMQGSSLSGMCMLRHYRQFTQEEVNAMVAEAVRITNAARIGTRRKELASKQTPIENPAQLNENLFPTDVTFFEAVLSDKYEFDIVRANVVEAVIEPTIRGV